MSNIAIKGATTGTGTFTIESPATNTDRTLTLPDEAGTVVSTAGADFTGDVTTTGSVGIGTASPSHALDIEQSSAVLRVAESGGSDLRLQVTSSASYVGTSVDDPLYFLINGNQRGRFTTNNGGFFGASNDGTYGSSYTTQNAHYFHNSRSDDAVLRVNATNASYASVMQYLNSTRTGSSSFFYLRSYSGDYNDQEFYVRGDGQVGADGSFFGGGADYAEYFEWSDGNASNEDRRGYTVVLEGNKVRKATDGDDASQIIGAVSSRPSVVGDADMDAWKDKYLKDDFGSYIRDENGERILNPDYDESLEYTPREDRQEWDAIGMMGKLRILKGQPVGDRWIKMRDISETVEEWLVR